jgi:2-polyprenyl-3-methyl-5-hydroxy-6-metoxy-1,4-benzoquinol methylase
MLPFNNDVDDHYLLEDGVFAAAACVTHADDAFDPAMFPVLHAMQERHFWYRGRHRFLWRAVNHWIAARSFGERRMRCIDIGGACGGWVRYLLERATPAEVAVGDSCRSALDLASTVVPQRVARYHLDVANLNWHERWDVVFLLDVLEHITDDCGALQEVYRAIAPGGLVFVTVPALRFFWSSYDEFDGHRRRYSRGDLVNVTSRAGFEVLDTRYFNFFLSPLVLLTRFLTALRSKNASMSKRLDVYRRSHSVPPHWINTALAAVFAAETPLGHAMPFPWGTSCLAVLRKPLHKPQ